MANKPRKARAARKAKVPQLVVRQAEPRLSLATIERLIEAENRKPYSFKFGAYWCQDIGLLPVIEPYICTGGTCGKSAGVRVSFLGGQAFAEWSKS